MSEKQVTYLDTMPLSRVDLAVVFSSGVSLFLELSVSLMAEHGFSGNSLQQTIPSWPVFRVWVWVMRLPGAGRSLFLHPASPLWRFRCYFFWGMRFGMGRKSVKALWQTPF